jgi:uncharacterized protein YbjT (DUF2867 family)
MDGRVAGNEMESERIFISGGTGFVGSNLLRALAGRSLRVLVRDQSRATPEPNARIEYVEGDLNRPESLKAAVHGCDIVINLVAIIEEQGETTFDQVIHQGTVNLLEAAKRAGIGRFIFMSALGARHDTKFPYLEAKWQAEQAVTSSGIPWTIFRPSVIFGPGDGFINTLADLVRKAPIVPVVGSGRSTFQPVAVGDVADCFVRAVDDPETIGETFELGGPDTFTYKQLLDVIAAKLGKRKPKVHIPVGLMKPVVALSKPLPKALRPPVTQEQLKMLAIDNCTDNSSTERLIGRRPVRLPEGIDYILR